MFSFWDTFWDIGTILLAIVGFVVILIAIQFAFFFVLATARCLRAMWREHLDQ